MYGIDGKMYIWLKIYLANRTQPVMYKNIFSSTAPIHAGVPQGSVLGPLLFLIHVNAVTRFCRLFTDDNCLLCSIHQNVSNLFKIV